MSPKKISPSAQFTPDISITIDKFCGVTLATMSTRGKGAVLKEDAKDRIILPLIRIIRIPSKISMTRPPKVDLPMYSKQQ